MQQQKSDAEAQNVDSTQTVNNNNAPYAEPTQSNAYTTKLAGKQFEITISRVADKTLPIVKDDLGKEFYDNRVDVVIKCNGQEFYKNSFTKDAFSEFLTTAADRQGTVLLGMAYDSAKSDGHAIRLGAQIGQVGIEEGPAFSIEIPLMAALQVLCAIIIKILRVTIWRIENLGYEVIGLWG